MSSRREARERVMQALYAFELGGGDAEHIIETWLKPNLAEDPAGLEFATSLFLRVLDCAEAADEIISSHTTNWDISRIALIDRLLLRMAICEMLTFEDIPPKVSINEAIEVAKRYSTSKSGKFINGILDAVLLDLQREGRLKKTGRGLIGMDSIRDRVAT
ncbi:transcription antitermination factor NusB [Rhodocaloribacter sp.]|jgi:N utilization substance protein B